MRRWVLVLALIGIAWGSLAPVVAWSQSRGSGQRKTVKSGKGTRSTATKRSASKNRKAAASSKPSPGAQGAVKSSKPAESRQTTGSAAPSKEQAKPAASSADKPLDYGAMPIKRMFNGKDLSGWHLRHADGKNAWKAENGILANTERGTDLVSDEKFTDFELHIEVNVPPGGNSGVYLQGRYEVQIADSAGQKELTTGMMGAIYSKIAPAVNAAKAAGEWQTLDIHFMQAVRDDTGKILLKPVVTIILNDELIADRVEIDRVTGGALDSEEGTPGPLMLQGDHTAVQYRNILIRPLPPRTAPKVEEEEPPAAPPVSPGSDR